MVLFLTQNDVKLKVKQFSTYSNPLQVGQVKKNQIFKGNTENWLFADLQSQPKWYFFRHRMNVKLKMKQVSTYSNPLQVGQVKKNQICKGNTENWLFSDMQSQPKWYFFRHGMTSN